MSRAYAALVHHPVLDRDGRTVTSAVTNLDVHDLARSCRTFGLARYFVVTPIAAQRRIVDQILEHWRDGPGARRVPERGEALARCVPIASLAAAVDDITAREGTAPWLLATSARPEAGRATTSYATARERIAREPRPVLLVLGTGHGLAPEVLAAADDLLAPIDGADGYNHLSVRAACAITLDRLFGSPPPPALTR